MSNLKETWLNQTIYYLMKDDVFHGNLLQELDIIFNTQIPTAALYFNQKSLKYVIELNPEYFKKISLPERIAVLKHEVLHFLNGHLFRFFTPAHDPKERKLSNIACDMSVNQYINNMPEGSIDVNKWKEYGINKPIAKFQTADYYLDVLKKTTQPPPEEKQNGPGEKSDEGSSSNWEEYKKYVPFDDHNWEEGGEDQQMTMEAAKELMKRTMEKTNFAYGLTPGYIDDFFKIVDEKLNKINYKHYLKWCIKKHLSSHDRKSTWNKPNKRYYNYSPGTKNDSVPFLNVYMDTSGSISYREMDEFYQTLKGWLQNSGKKCNLILWHTDIYLQKKFSLVNTFDTLNIQQGGTDVSKVLEHIEKHNPDLSLILTDGEYEFSTMKPKNQIIWIISKEGNKSHPLKHIGKTIRLE